MENTITGSRIIDQETGLNRSNVSRMCSTLANIRIGGLSILIDALYAIQLLVCIFYRQSFKWIHLDDAPEHFSACVRNYLNRQMQRKRRAR